MYNLIVVDDERHIREGIFKFINSSDIGIKAVACLSDGDIAIDYIEKNDVDIVITDIRMTRVSGLELSKYIYENKPNIKVIIISGFKEFEYAHQAIMYNVQNYLIKPTKPDEIKKKLSILKTELDEINSINIRSKMYEELIPAIREEFINDYLAGSLRSEESIIKKIEMLKLNPYIMNMPCLIIDINLNWDFQKWEYGKEGFHNFIHNTFSSRYGEFEVFKVSDTNYTSKFLLISTKENNKEEFRLKAIMDLETVKKDVAEITGTNLEITISTAYEDLEMVKRSSFSLVDTNYFNEKVKTFASYIVESKESEAVDILDSIINGIYDFDELKAYILRLFDTLNLNICENTCFEATELTEHSTEIMLADTKSKLFDVGKKIIANMLSRFEKRRDDTAYQIMAIAKKYIEENYNSDISLSDAAQKVYLSSVYFSKLFKKHIGENFSDYLVRVRMSHAVEFLKKNYKIEDISRLCGYNSSRYFYRIFKAYYGMNPKDYARKHFGGL